MRQKRRNRRRSSDMKLIISAVSFMFIIITILLILILVKSCTPTYSQYPESFKYTVGEGDVLWQIADIHCPEGMDKRDWIWYVSEYNGIHNTHIRPGQQIEVGTVVFRR